jgi:hypothetical protein
MGEELKQDIDSRYIVLELDTFLFKDKDPVPSYCVIGIDSITLEEVGALDRWQDLHAKLMSNYKIGNWNFCNQALEHLKGRWKNQLDSFYNVMQSRITKLENEPLPAGWNGMIQR